MNNNNTIVRCSFKHAPFGLISLNTSLTSANMNLLTAYSCSTGRCLVFPAFLTAPLRACQHWSKRTQWQRGKREGTKKACTHTHADTGIHTKTEATRKRRLLTVAYFPSSSYSWYSSVNRVEVTTVAMLTGEGGARVSGELVKVQRGKTGSRSDRSRELEGREHWQE